MRNFILAGFTLAAAAVSAQQDKAPQQQQCTPAPTKCVPAKCVSTTPYFYQGDLPLTTCNPTYNVPATVAIPCQWGGFVDASYLYWFAGEGGLDVASQAVMLGGGAVIPPNSNTNILYPTFEYSSGFKVGIGGMPGVDDWVIRADYTWVRQEVKSSFAAGAEPNGTGVLWLTSWFSQSSASNQPLACTSLSSDWDLGIDWVDASMSRPYYMGKSWTVTPFGGLRGSWIRQSYHVQINRVLNAAGPGSMASKNHSQSWGVGPRAGVEWHWLTTSRFRFQGEFGASLLYTKYTTLSHTEDPLTARTSPISYTMNDPAFLQAMAEANLGFAWCAYWGTQARVDFAATYDFNLLWNQNLMRTLNDNIITGVNPASNNLFLHGLTATVRCDF